MCKKQLGAKLNNESGFVLVIGLVLTAMIAAMGMAALQSTGTEVDITRNQKVSNQLLYAAEAGVDKLSNRVWTDSGFGSGGQVSFDSLDNLSYLAGSLPSRQESSVEVGTSSNGPTTYFDSAVIDFDSTDSSKRTVTIESRGWQDSNGNGSFNVGEPSKTIETKIEFAYESLDFPFGVLTQNTECLFCHLHVNGDVVSLSNMTVKDKAYSVVTGSVFAAGTTNIGEALVMVAQDYAGAAVDVTTGYSDPRFPLDGDGNPLFPKVENLDYYKGLAAAHNGGAGSSITGGTIEAVATGSTYAAGTGVLGTLTESYAGNLILDGTATCLVLDGPVVVDKDVIIKGCVSGQGNIYSGGSIFIAGSVSYQDSANDKLGLSAGGNITFGDYRPGVGGEDFIKKAMAKFNVAMQASSISSKRYYAFPDGLVYEDKNMSRLINTGGADVVGYLPTNTWITDNEYVTNYLDNVNGITRIDGLLYTSNAIFGINKIGDQQTTITGSIVSADIGLLVSGPSGKTEAYDPALVGLTINYDSRMKDFVTIAKNPIKSTVSWKEVEASSW